MIDRLMIELSDIQGESLYPRPSPYAGKYVLIRIDDPRAGRELLRRLMPSLTPATDSAHAYQKAWVGVALTFQGLKALGVPQSSLDSTSRGKIGKRSQKLRPCLTASWLSCPFEADRKPSFL